VSGQQSVISWVLTAKDQTASTFGAVDARLAKIGITSNVVRGKGLAMGVGMVAAGALIVKGIDSAVSTALDFNKAFAVMDRQIGATGKTADMWNNTFRKVFSASPGATLDNVARVLGIVGTRLKTTESSAAIFATTMFRLARIQGEDVVPLTDAGAKAFQNWGFNAKDAAMHGDFLTAVATHTGISITDLFTALTRMGPALRLANIGFNQGAAMLGAFNKAGVDVGRAQMAMQKALTTTAKDMTTGKLKAKDLHDGLMMQFDAIMKAKTGQDQLALATHLFGARTAPVVLDAMKKGILTLHDMTHAYGDTSGALLKNTNANVTLEGRMAAMHRQVLLAKEAIGNGLAPVLVSILVPISKVVKEIAGFLQQHPMIAKMVAVFSALAAAALLFGGTAIIILKMKTALETLKVGTGIVKALNLAMDANPAILIGAAIVALGVIVYLCYKKFEPFRNIVDTVGRSLRDIGQTIWGGLVTAFNWVKTHWVLVVGLILAPFITIPVLLARWLGPKILPVLARFFEALPGQILNLTKDAGKWLLSTGETILKGLVQGLFFGLKLAVVFFIGLPIFMLVMMVKANIWLVQKGIEIINGLVTGFVAALPAIGQFFLDLPGNILKLVVNVGHWLVQTGINLLKGMAHGIGVGAVAVWNWLTALPGKIVTTVGNVSRTLYQKGLDLLVGFLNAEKQGWINIYNWFVALPGRVVSAVGSMAGTLMGLGRQLIAGLLAGAVAAAGFASHTAGTVGAWLVALPGKVGSVIVGAATAMIGTGRSIIDGLLGGFKKAWPEIVAWVKAQGAKLLDFFKHPWKILSPSHVMQDLGGNIMKGMQIGLQKQYPGVVSTIRNISQGLQGQFGVTTMSIAPVAGRNAPVGGTVASILQAAQAPVTSGARSIVGALAPVAAAAATPAAAPDLVHIESVTLGQGSTTQELARDLRWMQMTKIRKSKS